VNYYGYAMIAMQCESTVLQNLGVGLAIAGRKLIVLIKICPKMKSLQLNQSPEIWLKNKFSTTPAFAFHAT
jgi:hypothetical protein